MSGESDLSILGIDTVSSLVKAGKIRALGITSAKRSSTLSDLPTIAEAGVPGYEFTSSTPAQFASHIKSELARWNKVVKAMGLRAE